MASEVAEKPVVSCLMDRTPGMPWGRIVQARPVGWSWSTVERSRYVVISRLSVPEEQLGALHAGGLRIHPKDPNALTAEEVEESMRPYSHGQVIERHIAPELHKAFDYVPLPHEAQGIVAVAVRPGPYLPLPPFPAEHQVNANGDGGYVQHNVCPVCSGPLVISQSGPRPIMQFNCGGSYEWDPSSHKIEATRPCQRPSMEAVVRALVENSTRTTVLSIVASYYSEEKAAAIRECIVVRDPGNEASDG